MAIRADSYSSVAEVTAYTRHLLDGQISFDSTTRPTLTEVEKFIDRVSGVLNLSIAKNGFEASSVLANSTAKLVCDDWVTQQAVRYVELTQRGTGYNADEGSRTAAFNVQKDAFAFIADCRAGFIQLGITQSQAMSEGLMFTGLDAQADRSDPDDTSLEQPLFRRGQWDNEE